MTTLTPLSRLLHPLSVISSLGALLEVVHTILTILCKMQANLGGFKSVGLAYKPHHGTGSFFFPHFGGGYEIVLFVHISGILLKIDHLSSPISSGTRQIPNFAVDFGERPHDAVEDLVGRFGFYPSIHHCTIRNGHP